ncbi:MAG: hypothetical protein ACYS5W_23645 [Planctomycetota bacterium]|jgi:hypothetical protein
MPDPKSLRVDDRVRFVALPDEWRKPGYTVDPESVELMETLIARRRSCRVSGIAEDGYPWIEARVRDADGQMIHHSWGIYESTGWIRVRKRV